MKKENKTIKQMEAYTKPVVGIHKIAAEKGFTSSVTATGGYGDGGNGGTFGK